jgi:aryl-alcohol dehydrogenase-like predicted oxidoreductase
MGTEKRVLGQSGIVMPHVMIGGNVFGWTTDKATSFRVSEACLGAGLNAIDTGASGRRDDAARRPVGMPHHRRQPH